MFDMTRLYVFMTHSYVRHDSDRRHATQWLAIAADRSTISPPQKAQRRFVCVFVSVCKRVYEGVHVLRTRTHAHTYSAAY